MEAENIIDKKETLGNKEYYVPPLCDREYTINEDDQFSFCVVGDMHLHGSIPKSRLDNYPETCCQKLAILRKKMVDVGSKYLFCAGDIFHVSKERSDFEYAVIQEFLKFKEAGITVFISTGN